MEAKVQAAEVRAGVPVVSGYVHLVILCGFLGWVFIYADRMTFSPLLIPISRSLSLTLTEAGFILSAYMVGYVGMQIPFSMLSDKIGLKTVLVPFYYLSGLSTLLIGILGVLGVMSYQWLLALALLMGFSAAAFMPQMTALTNYNFPQGRRAYYNSLVQIGSPVGLMVALLSAGPLYVATGQWSLPLIALGGLTVMLATVFLVGLRNPEVAAVAEHPAQLSRAFSDRNLLLLYLLAFCIYYGNWVLISWGPSFFHLNRGLPLDASGPLTAIYALLSIPSAVFFSRLSDRWQRRKPLITGFLPLAALLLFLAAYVSDPLAISVVLALYGVVGALTLNPIMAAWANDFIAAGKGAVPRATVMGVLNFSFMMAALLAPSVTPAVGAIAGSLEWGFYLGVLVTLVGFGISFFIGEGIPPDDKSL